MSMMFHYIPQFAPTDALLLPFIIIRELVIKEKDSRIIQNRGSLVDTRSINRSKIKQKK